MKIAFIVIGILAIIAYALYKYLFTIPADMGELSEVTGPVKTGKTAWCVYLIEQMQKKNLKAWDAYRRKCIRTGKRIEEMPKVYSNMPIRSTSYELTAEHVKGQYRFENGSIAYFNECALLAGSMDYKNPVVNRYLTEWFKTCAHQLGSVKGCFDIEKFRNSPSQAGVCICDTQSPNDLHYAIKRSVQNVYYIEKKVRLPFFDLLRVRTIHPNLTEMGVEETEVVEAETKPLKKVYRWYAYPHRVWKDYDRYAYSPLTDGKPVYNKVSDDSLKVKEIVTLEERGKANETDRKNQR